MCRQFCADVAAYSVVRSRLTAVLTTHSRSSLFAGTVLASRLSEDPNWRVLLLEAGPEEPSVSSVPAFAFAAVNTTYDWRYETVPQKRACLANGGVCHWPRGKMLCGTACLSGKHPASGTELAPLKLFSYNNASG